MNFETKPIDVSRIYLDNENPRHDPIDTEPEIISYLIEKENIKALARHIASIGSTSPLERIGVIRHPKAKGAYVSVEGNRRLCALKLLGDPDKADTEANKKYFRALAEKMERRPEQLEAVIFPDKQVARPWISLRHEGEQDGVGTKSWKTDQKARFNTQGSGRRNPDVQAYLLKEYARQQGLLDEDQADTVSITTLTRYLSNPVFRATLGLADTRKLSVTVPTDEFNKVVKRFLHDVMDPSSGVSSRTDADARKAYAEKLRSEGVAPLTRDLKPFDVSTGSRPRAEETGTVSRKRRNNRSPDQRRTVIPRAFSAHIKDKVLKRLYDELRELDAEDFSFAATYLLRATIEQAATLLLKKAGKSVDRELHKNLERVAKLLADDGLTDRQLKTLRTMSTDRDSRYSPDTLGHFVHGGAIPTHTQGIRLWDSIEDVMSEIFSRLE